MGQMDGKVAIVTGSGRGIGKEIALRLVRDGAKVVINDIDEAPAKETIAEIEKMGGKAVACNGDVAKPDFGDRIRKLGTRFTSITWPGDVITLSGKVTGKREEGGEKLIDLEVRCTNQNGQDTLQGHATVAAA